MQYRIPRTFIVECIKMVLIFHTVSRVNNKITVFLWSFLFGFHNHLQNNDDENDNAVAMSMGRASIKYDSINALTKPLDTVERRRAPYVTLALTTYAHYWRMNVFGRAHTQNGW